MASEGTTPAYVRIAKVADGQGSLKAQLETIQSVAGDALLLSILRVPSMGPENRNTCTVLCRYLIGAPDGLQRALMDTHVRKLGTIKALFILNHSASHTGGLVGLRFAMSDAGAESLSIVGPAGTASLVDSTRPFVVRKYPDISCADLGPREEYVFDDDVITVTASGLSFDSIDVDPEDPVLTLALTDPAAGGAEAARPSCPKGHVLEKYQTPVDGCWCSTCLTTAPVGAPFFGCRACDFDLCLSCHAGGMAPATSGGDSTELHRAKCPQQHPLSPYPTPCDGCWCSRCSKSSPAGAAFFGCRACDYDLCSSCSGLCSASAAESQSVATSMGSDAATHPLKRSRDSSVTSERSAASNRLVLVKAEAKRLLGALQRELGEADPMDFDELRRLNPALAAEVFAAADAAIPIIDSSQVQPGSESAAVHTGTNAIALLVRLQLPRSGTSSSSFAVVSSASTAEARQAKRWLEQLKDAPDFVFHLTQTRAVASVPRTLGQTPTPQHFRLRHGPNVIRTSSRVLPRGMASWAELNTIAPVLFPSLPQAPLAAAEVGASVTTLSPARLLLRGARSRESSYIGDGDTDDDSDDDQEVAETEAPDATKLGAPSSLTTPRSRKSRSTDTKVLAAVQSARTWLDRRVSAGLIEHEGPAGEAAVASSGSVEPVPDAPAHAAAAAAVDGLDEGGWSELSNRAAAEAMRRRLAPASRIASGTEQAPSRNSEGGYEMHLVVLGSGSARPSPVRNCSGVLLYATSRAPAAGPSGPVVWALLLDCGEGILGQIETHFSAATAAAVLGTLAGVWVSHAHADHHAGLPALLERVNGLREQATGLGATAGGGALEERAPPPKAPRADVGGGPGGGGSSSGGGGSERCGGSGAPPLAWAPPAVASGPPLGVAPGTQPWFFGSATGAMQHAQWQQASRPPGPPPPQRGHPPPLPPPLPPPRPPPRPPPQPPLRQHVPAVAAPARRPFVLVAAPEVLAHVRERSKGAPLPFLALVEATPPDANWPDSPAHRCLVEGSRVAAGPPGGGGGGYGGFGFDGGPLLLSLASVPVVHCPGAVGAVLTFNQSLLSRTCASVASPPPRAQLPPPLAAAAAAFVVVYSGDTRPCALLNAAGRNAGLLVHEATFDDDRLGDAKAKKHSTVGEALSAGHAMALRGLLVLTHFSQRYPRGYAAARAGPLRTGAATAGAATAGAAAGAATGAAYPLASSFVTVMAHDHLELRDVVTVAASVASSAATPTTPPKEAFSAPVAAAATTAATEADRVRQSIGLLEEYFTFKGTSSASCFA